jgi:hypothetical protein
MHQYLLLITLHRKIVHTNISAKSIIYRVFVLDKLTFTYKAIYYAKTHALDTFDYCTASWNIACTHPHPIHEILLEKVAIACNVMNCDRSKVVDVSLLMIILQYRVWKYPILFKNIKPEFIRHLTLSSQRKIHFFLEI